ncbi:hypothetical protein Bca101_019009 [Brassica carinata]
MLRKMNSKSEEDVENRGFPTKCVCGGNTMVLTSRIQQNPCRPFFRFQSKKEDHLFKWVEDAIFEEVDDALPRLGSLETELRNVKSSEA